MTKLSRFSFVSTMATVALVCVGPDATSQEPAALSIAAGYAADLDALRQWDATVDGMAGTGELVVVSRLNDASLEGHAHEYLAQYHAGVAVHGGGVSRQLDAAGVTISLFGTLYQGIDVNVTPALSGAEVAALLEEMHGAEVVAAGQPSLVILPGLEGSYTLTYLIAMSDRRFHFADADDGHIVHSVDAVRSQAAVGEGTGVKGDLKKLSTNSTGSRFEAHDMLRPAEIVTLDAQRDDDRVDHLIDDHFIQGLPEGSPIWTADDVAADPDNVWDEAAVVDAHAHTGWMYDYFHQRHGWEGLDGENGRILSIVNFELRNAFFAPPPFGPEGTGVMGYGTAPLEMTEEPWTNLDTVAHEMTHGVMHYAVSERTDSPFGLTSEFSAAGGTLRLGPTSFTDGAGTTRTCETTAVVAERLTRDGPVEVRLPAWCVDGRFVLASGQGRAVDEAIADIFAEAAGFFHEDAGAPADYIQEGDQEDPVIRSLLDPRSVPLTPRFPQYVFPDAYGDRYEFALLWVVEGEIITFSPWIFLNGQYVLRLSRPGYGGEHWNSTILSHAFYLAIEGGTHRTSGMTVEGVGGDNRAEIERIFFRAIAELIPARASLPIAAAVIRQAAFDLAPGSDAQRAIDQALRAVGL